MKKKNLIPFLILLGVLSSIFVVSVFQYHTVVKPSLYKTPPEILNDMKKRYLASGRTSEKISSFTKQIEFPISSFTTIMDEKLNYEITDTLRVHFVQITPAFITKVNDAQFKQYENKLWIAFEYVDKNSNRIGNVFLFNNKGKKYIIDNDLALLKSAYSKNIQSEINDLVKNSDKNTDYAKVGINELSTYINDIKTSSLFSIIYPETMKIELTESSTTKKIDQAGYFTFFTDVYSNWGIEIKNLSDYDMNSLCPPNCP